MQSPHSLMARIWKAQDFHDGNIFKCSLKKKVFYVWKSLLVGRDLLKKGLCFVTGDGSTVNMWTDLWLPEHTPRPSRPLEMSMIATIVSSYIKTDGSRWNIDKLREDVMPEDVKKILGLKISSKAQCDLLN